jgi:radical SAM protein with 4Fe4S-binding SPASM domain
MACGDCIQHQIGSAEFLDALAAKESGSDLPLAGSLELTLRCNVRCKHCYILYPGATDGEMSTGQVKTVLDRLAAGGVLFLLMTGGEIFARCDFREIYLHAKRLGFLITLYTNATLIDESLADFLALWRPRRIEITVYGHTEATYEAITGVRGSFNRFRRGVALLHERKLPLYLKTIVLKTNEHEFEAIRDWAHGLGAKFRYDAMVNPKLNGDLAPVAERIDPEAYVRLEGTSDEDATRYRRLVEMATSSTQVDERLFKCGAGIRTFHVDPRGHLHPCMMWRTTPYDLLGNGLDGWNAHVDSLRSRQVAGPTKCTSCSGRLACGNCAATSLVETGIAGRNVDYYCRITKARDRIFIRPGAATGKEGLVQAHG